MTASTLRWPLFAVLGLLVALAVGLLATKLTSERIGISSEPITAGESLTPHREARQHAHSKRPHQPGATTPVQTSSTATGYTGSGSSSDGSSGDPKSAGSDGGDSAGGALKPSTSPPAAGSPAPSAPASGGNTTRTEPEPGDD